MSSRNQSRSHAPRNSLLSGQNIGISGGTFIQNNGGDGRKSSFDILREAVAHTAFHDSGASFDPPKCHPNTRVAVLNKIMDWIRRPNSERMDEFIMWLTGAAGAGKSAIAQSLIELCLLSDLVIASFFFGRSDGNRNHGGAFVATLAYQIYYSVPAAQQKILSAIDADAFILTRNIEHQLVKLITEPLHSIHDSEGSLWPGGHYRVIVIDGLDECLNETARLKILRAISQLIRDFKLPILFLIASRPEHDISVEFRFGKMEGIYTRLYLDNTYNPDDDIRTFLLDRFGDIRRNHPFKSHIPAAWPDPDTIENLVQKSSGQFIYAAVVILYVQSIRHLPNYRLDIVMNVRPAQNDCDLPFAELDALFTMILSLAADIDRVLYALSIYSLHVFEGEFDISGFMSLRGGELEVLFCDLGSLVTVERTRTSTHGKRGPLHSLRILHASLHDFLLDKQRSKQYFIDINTYRMKHIEDIFYHLTLASDYDISLRDVEGYLSNQLPLCQPSATLLPLIDSFPLEELIGKEISFKRKRPFYETEARVFVFFHLLPFLKRMSLLDQRWSTVEQRQLAALETFFLSQMPSYHDLDNQIALLCLVHHLGDDACVPWTSNLGQADFLISELGSNDTLLLKFMDPNHLGTHKDQYRQVLRRFLNDPKRSGRYTLGLDSYPKLVLYIIKVLNKTSFWVGHSDEKSTLERLTINNGAWHFEDDRYNISEHWFLLLGYIIFFLPRCGRSESIIHHCQNQSFLTEQLTNALPTRTALVRQAIKDYLKRVQK